MSWIFITCSVVAVFVLVRLPAKWFVVAVILAMWATRWQLPVGGVGIRAENLVGAAAAIQVAMMARRYRDRVPKSCLIAWIAVATWLALASLTAGLISVEPFASLKVIVWAAGGFATALWIALNSHLWRWVVTAGTWIGLAFIAIALAAWTVSTAGLATVLVQTDPAYGGYAAYGMSHEANLFAGLVCLWAILSAFNPGGALTPALRIAVVASAPLAIVAAHTRAALVALALGMVLWFLSTFRWTSFRWKSMRWTPILTAGGAVVVLGVGVSYLTGLGKGLQKFAHPFDLAGGTGGQRLSTSTVALDEWAAGGPRSWLFGLGSNSFGQRHLDPTRPFEKVQDYLGILPVQLLYDGGVVAVTLIVLAVGATGYPLLRRVDRVSVMVLAVGGAYFTISLATSSIWLLQTWVLAGLGWAAVVRSRSHQPSTLAASAEFGA